MSAEKTKVDAAQTKVNQLNMSIVALSQEIVAGVTQKTKIQASLPALQSKLAGLQTAKQLAKVAAQSTKQDVTKKNAVIAKRKVKLGELQQTCALTPTPQCQSQVTKLQNRIGNLESELTEATTLHSAANQNMKAANQAFKKQEIKIKKANEKVASIETSNATKSAQMTAKQTALAGANAQAALAQAAFKPALVSYQTSLTKRQGAVQAHNQERKQLIKRIIRLNHMGSNQGREAGLNDGVFYASYIGIDAGQDDGDRDGTNDGIAEGKRRSYNAGFARGEVQGEIDGASEGQSEGTAAGIIAGNIDAATDKAEDDGELRAKNSNAAALGKAEGKVAGKARSVRVGDERGTPAGQTEAIREYEAMPIKNKDMNGDFAGAFSPLIPSYPGFDCVYRSSTRYRNDDYGWRRHRDFQVDREICPSFKPRHPKLARIQKRILKKAFRDAYIAKYRKARRRTYIESIDNIYLSAYNGAEESAYRVYSETVYPERVSVGQSNGHDQGYNNICPGVFSSYKSKLRAQYSANPNMEASEYINTYENVEESTYNSVYRQIKKASFVKFEESTYQANIAQQTEIFKLKRKGEIAEIYNNNPVLDFISSEVIDGGINKIAQKDGVTQPNETLYHNVTLVNYGHVAANNVKVVMENGSKNVIKSVPAQSQVTFKGAVKSSIPASARAGSRYQSVLTVYADLNSNEPYVQGRHFKNVAQGKMNNGDKKNYNVQYPLQLSQLRLSSVLLINKRNQIGIFQDS
jgi:hypothetical protein